MQSPKHLVNRIIITLLNFYDQLARFPRNGEYFITPQPSYVSQFASIQPPSINSSTILTKPNIIKFFGAKDSKEFNFWAWRACGIVCVQMILKTIKPQTRKTTMDLIHEGVSLGGYIVYQNGKFIDKGWFHDALVNLLKKYQLKAVSKRWQTLKAISRDVLKNKFVIASIVISQRAAPNYEFNSTPSSGHLILITGVKINNRQPAGFYYHDPTGLPNANQNTYLPTEIFNRIFTNRTIVANK